MIVTRETFFDVLARLSTEMFLALDTETTGLRPYHEDMLFSIIIATRDAEFYFNFNEYPRLDESFLLGAEHFAALKGFCKAPKTWFLHNAKFDMAMLAREGIELEGIIHCTKAIARIEYNVHPIGTYDLGACAARIGLEKSDEVDAYISKNKLWAWVDIPGKAERDKKLFFNQVPWVIITRYGLQDGRITWKLGMAQIEALDKLENSAQPEWPSIWSVAHDERRLTQTVFEMERVGIKVNLEFCRKAIEYETQRSEKAKENFKERTGEDFKNSPKLFARVFKDETLEYTEKGNATFDSDVLETFTHLAAKAILEVRDAKSKSDFYNGFIYQSDKDGQIHTNFDPGGTVTGRFSSSNPNLQNLTKSEGEELKEEFVIRRAFVPRPGFVFVMMDYDQMEYRLMLEYAGAMNLINLVKSGLDVHQATADLASITRNQAKTTNFLTLYGGGVKKLAANLKCTPTEARGIQDSVFRASPEIKTFIKRAQLSAEKRGYVFDWAGGRLYYPDARFAYKAPNGIIQGGCARVVKKAMNQCAAQLKDLKSRLVLQIHDELVFEIHESEFHVIPLLKHTMESVFPARHLPLTCGVDHSYQSLADKVKGLPT